MFEKLLHLSIEKKLALLAVTLGVVALFAGNVYDSTKIEIDAKELALIVENKVDHITVDELADWIIKGIADYRLVDLNEEKDFTAYHIPGAQNVRLSTLTDGTLLRNEKIVLYSSGGIHSAQGWMLLKAKGYKAVYMLLGGIEEWKDKVLFPVIPDSIPNDRAQAFALLIERSKYFGGAPQSASPGLQTSALPLSAPALPKVTAPAGGGGTAPTAKKKKEGC
jgi:rhodanese-related sulfurtransferase